MPVPAPLNDPVRVTPAPLAQPQVEAPASKRSKWIFWAVVGGIVLQLFGPYNIKPTTIVGGMIADMTRQTSSALVENQLLLAKSAKLAESIAELEASYADKIGKCNLFGLMGPDAARLCISLAKSYHEPALEKARRELANIEQQLRRR
jgi:hypothetical protein